MGLIHSHNKVWGCFIIRYGVQSLGLIEQLIVVPARESAYTVLTQRYVYVDTFLTQNHQYIYRTKWLPDMHIPILI